MGDHVWAEKYDGELQDIFDLQDKITQQVVAAIQTQVWTHIGERAKKLDHPDIGTWDLLARGFKLYYELTEESLAAAENIFRKAMTTDPRSCEANFCLSGVLTHQLFMGYVSNTTAIVSEALDLAKQAVSLDENNEYAHIALGNIQFYRGQQDSAVAELKHAIELNPNCSVAYGFLGAFLSESDPDEAIKNQEIAIRINPRDPSIFFRYHGLARAHFASGRYLEASQWARKSVNRKPSWRGGHAYLAASLAQLNQLEEAKEAVNNYLENFPDETISYLQKLWSIEGPDNPFVEGLCKAGLPE
jgi:tetratricopeptide (TPR) repeat protein